MTSPRPTTEEAGQIIGCDHIAWGSVAECPYCGTVNDMVPKAVHREEVAEALAPRPTTEEGRCGCSCGCHNRTGHAGMYRGCHNAAKWLPEYKVWACDPCLVTCDD